MEVVLLNTNFYQRLILSLYRFDHWGLYQHTLLKETQALRSCLKMRTSDHATSTLHPTGHTATEYASSHLRINGDAGCFIDPLFSSSIHPAPNSEPPAAITICASMRGDCSQETVISWHSNKVVEGYTRFLPVVTRSTVVSRTSWTILMNLDSTMQLSISRQACFLNYTVCLCFSPI